MDLNDVDNRLDMLEIALRKQLEVSKPSSKPFINRQTGQFRVSVQFGNRTTLEMRREIHSVLGELASLKDIIKINLQRRGLDGTIVERAVDSSLYLQLLLDLNNEFKHGHPLRKYRSGRKPVIENIVEALELPPHTSVAFEVEYFTGEVKMDKELFAKVTADIMDRNGSKICSLDDLMKNCIGQLRTIADEHHLRE